MTILPHRLLLPLAVLVVAGCTPKSPVTSEAVLCPSLSENVVTQTREIDRLKRELEKAQQEITQQKGIIEAGVRLINAQKRLINVQSNILEPRQSTSFGEGETTNTAGSSTLDPSPAEREGTGNGATALCNDGTYSYAAHHQGACSWHGGVKVWYK